MKTELLGIYMYMEYFVCEIVVVTNAVFGSENK
jgi:hypothetical protein